LLLDGVDEGLFEGEADAEDLLLAGVVSAKQALDLLLHDPGLGGITRDHDVHGGRRADLAGRSHDRC